MNNQSMTDLHMTDNALFDQATLSQPVNQKSISEQSSSIEDSPDSLPDITLKAIQKDECCGEQAEDSTVSKCVVCGAQPATFHYGALSCNSCKIFFLRAVVANGSFVCTRKGNCPIPKSKCRACRLEKCLKKGMVTKAAGLRRRCKPASSTASSEPSSCTPSELSVVPYFTNDACSVFPHLATMLNLDGCDIISIVKNLLEVERRCDNDDFCSPLVTAGHKYSFQISLGDALTRTTAVCERTPIGWSSNPLPYTELKDAPEHPFKPLYLRILLHQLDWMNASPELHTMLDSDRLEICKKCTVPYALLTMMYNTYRVRASNSMMFCHGTSFVRNNQQVEDGSGEHYMQLYTNELVEDAQHIVSGLSEMGLLEEEYVILKKILFFTAASRTILSDSGNEIVRKLRIKYAHAFMKLLPKLHPSITEPQMATRLSKLFDIVMSILRRSTVDEVYFARMIVLNTLGMNEPIVRELHL